MKKILLVTALVFGLAPQSRAGIPVSVMADMTATINQIQNFAHMLKEYATMVQQLEQMQNQFKQMELEYSSITGSRNLGDILNDPSLKEYLPDNWQSVYSGIRNGGYEGLSGSAKALRDASKIFDACEKVINPTEKKICNAQAVKPAQDQSFANDAYQKSKERVDQIEGLMQEINNTNDPKAIAELAARIQAEQALIQNEQTKLSLYQASAEAEERLLEQQRNEAEYKMLASRQYGTVVPPLEF
jgi:type IV secretion system protein VirB5